MTMRYVVKIFSYTFLILWATIARAGDLPPDDSSFRLLPAALERLNTQVKRIHPRTVARFEELYAAWAGDPGQPVPRAFSDLTGHLQLDESPAEILALAKIHGGGGEPAYRLYEALTGDPAAVFPAGRVDAATRADLTVALWSSGISLKPAEASLMILEERLAEADPELREEFVRRYGAWQNRLNRTPKCYDPQYRKVDGAWRRYFAECESGPEFEQLVALGEAVLPLLAEKTLEPGGYVAMRAFDRIRPAPQHPVGYDGLTMLSGKINSWAMPAAQLPEHILRKMRERRPAPRKREFEDSRLTDGEKKRLQQKVDAVGLATRARFNSLYLGWKQYIADNPRLGLRSRTHDYATGPQMRELEGMGKEIIPLVLQKSLDDFFILPLYEKLQSDTPYLVDWNGLGGEADRAVKCVKLWLKEIDAYD